MPQTLIGRPAGRCWPHAARSGGRLAAPPRAAAASPPPGETRLYLGVTLSTESAASGARQRGGAASRVCGALPGARACAEPTRFRRRFHISASAPGGMAAQAPRGLCLCLDTGAGGRPQTPPPTVTRDASRARPRIRGTVEWSLPPLAGGGTHGRICAPRDSIDKEIMSLIQTRIPLRPNPLVYFQSACQDQLADEVMKLSL